MFLSPEILAHKTMTFFVDTNWSFWSLLCVTEDKTCERELKRMKKSSYITERNIRESSSNPMS